MLDDDTADPDRRDAAEFADGILAALTTPGARRRRAAGPQLWPRRNTATRRISRRRVGPARLARQRPERRHDRVRRRRPSRTSREPARTRDHYSYTVYADPATARTFDDRRFGGPIGELVAGTQARVLANFIGRIQDRSMLDVGTGTGRAALLLARAGAQVTGVDASEQMLAVARQRAAETGVTVAFPALATPTRSTFPDRAFDVAVSLRVLMHTPRVARCASPNCAGWPNAW